MHYIWLIHPFYLFSSIDVCVCVFMYVTVCILLLKNSGCVEVPYSAHLTYSSVRDISSKLVAMLGGLIKFWDIDNNAAKVF